MFRMLYKRVVWHYEVVDDFTYLGSTISSNLSLDVELNTRIGKAATAMAHLNKIVWSNAILTTNTKMRVYQACVFGDLLYGSKSWTLYLRQERRLNTLHSLTQTDTSYSMAGPLNKQGRPRQRQHSNNVWSPLSDTFTLAWA